MGSKKVRNFAFWPLGLLAWPLSAYGFLPQPAENPPQAHFIPQSVSALPYTHAVSLGLVQGVTETLPISSSTHLGLLVNLLGYTPKEVSQSQSPRAGKIYPLESNLKAPPGRPELRPRPDKLWVDAFCVILQGFSMLAVALFYRRRLLLLGVGLWKRDPSCWRYLANLLRGTLPAALLGFSAKEALRAHLFCFNYVWLNLLLGAGVLVATHFYLRRRDSQGGVPYGTVEELPPRRAWALGALQCLALLPGMSRLLWAWVPGLLLGLTPQAAVELAFFLGLTLVSGAAAYQAWDQGPAVLAHLGWQPVLCGSAVCFLATALSIPLAVRLLERRSLLPLAFYRSLLAVLVGR